jgi:adenylate cyclase class 2
MASNNGHEDEIKLAIPDADAGRAILGAAGFRILKPRVFESNTVFDTPRQSLRGRGSLLRVREAGEHATLTYKGTPEASRHKSREELELEIPDAPTMKAIIGRLGFLPLFQYEKYRTEYQQPGGAGIATLDETPVGCYLELEGDPEWIDRTAGEFGFEESQYITASYAGLYLEWCAKRGIEPTNMVF